MTRWIGGIAVFICIVLFVSFKLYERDFRLSHVPEGLNVTTVLYANEQSWGLPFFSLPGDNETGVIAYEIPLSTAKEIEKVGIEYLKRLPQKAGDNRDWRGRYVEWQHTPLSDGNWVTEPISGAKSASPRLDFFLNKYGFGINVDPDVEREINEAIARPGSYFANGRTGTLIVIPSKRRIVYVYAG